MRRLRPIVVLAVGFTTQAMALPGPGEGQATFLAAALLALPNVCPAWSAQLPKLNQLVASNGYTLLQLGRPPLSAKVEAISEFLTETTARDPAKFCTMWMQELGPTGVGLFVPR